MSMPVDEKLLAEPANSQNDNAISTVEILNLKLIEMNRKLEAAESLKTNFLSNIRNEIVNPLSCITDLAGQILHLKNEKEIALRVSMICSEANNLDFQLRNIFIAAALEAGDIDPKIILVDVEAIIKDVIESFSDAAVNKSITIDLVVPQPAVPFLVATDKEKIEIIFANLLSNAIEFSPVGEVVTVSLARGMEGSLVLTVSDRGAGIAAENHKLIFDRFTQLETGTMRSHHGHGLGLCIIRTLSDLLGGSVTVQSAPGIGATFVVTLPPFEALVCEDGFSKTADLFYYEDMSEK